MRTRTYGGEGGEVTVPPIPIQPAEGFFQTSWVLAYCLLHILLHMDRLGAGIQCAVHFHFLAFEFLYLVLVVNVVHVASVSILELILVARFYDRASKALGICR